MPKDNRIPSLDGLRAISIALVLIGHGADRLADGPFRTLMVMFVGNSALGVSIFFVISGFLITGLLVDEEKRVGNISLPKFYFRRTFRILPAFYTYVLVLMLLTHLDIIKVPLSDVLKSMGFVWNYTEHETWYLAHTWSLSVEEQFYLIWPATLFLLGRRRATKIAVGLLVCGPALRVATYFLMPSYRVHMGGMLHTRVDTLMFGCVTALLYNDPRFKAICQRAFQPAILILLSAFLFIISPAVTIYWGSYWLSSLGYSLEGACIALLLVWLVQRPTSTPGRLLNTWPMIYIGFISYSLYLWQQLFLTRQYTIPISAFPLNLFCTFLAAIASYHLIEQPFLKLRVALQRRRHREREAIVMA